MMVNLRSLRYKLRVAVGVLLGINVLAAGMLVYMLVRGSGTLPEEFQSLHAQIQNRKGVVVPPQKVEERVKEAREQIAKLSEDRFPNSTAAVFEELGKLASENRVKLIQANYKIDDTEQTGIQQMTVDAGLEGDYVQVVKF